MPASLFLSLVKHDPSEIIEICYFDHHQWYKKNKAVLLYIFCVTTKSFVFLNFWWMECSIIWNLVILVYFIFYINVKLLWHYFYSAFSMHIKMNWIKWTEYSKEICLNRQIIIIWYDNIIIIQIIILYDWYKDVYNVL